MRESLFEACDYCNEIKNPVIRFTSYIALTAVVLIAICTIISFGIVYVLFKIFEPLKPVPMSFESEKRKRDVGGWEHDTHPDYHEDVFR